MKRLLVCLFMLALLLGCLGTLAAQEDKYVVQKGDSLWKLAGSHLYTPLLWEQIYRDNPFLQEPGRRFQKNGIVYVMVRPGEKLVGLEKLAIVAEMTPIDRLQLEQPAPMVYRVATTPAWVWWPLGLALLALIGVYLMYRTLQKDPATSGPAIVPGGVNQETAGSRFQEMAARQYQSHTGRIATVQEFTILRQTAGRIWGVMNVRYANGSEAPRQLRGERAYEARVRFPNGTEETLYMLQACGNDLRYGGISRYLPGPHFRFEADPAPAPAPETQPVTATPVEPAPTPVVETIPPTDGTISFEFKRATAEQPNLVRLQGISTEEFHFSVGPNGTTLRYREAVAN